MSAQSSATFGIDPEDVTEIEDESGIPFEEIITPQSLVDKCHKVGCIPISLGYARQLLEENAELDRPRTANQIAVRLWGEAGEACWEPEDDRPDLGEGFVPCDEDM